jgi:hypothetical protein
MKYKEFLSKLATSQLVVIPALERAGFTKKAKALSYCGFIKHYSICQYDYTAHFNGNSSCRDRFCPICQKKRSMLYFARFALVIRDLLSKGYYVNMLNFTVTDCDNLQENLDILTKAFRYIQHDNKAYREQFKKSFVGGLICKEIKQGENSNKWHSHFHALVIKDHFSKDFDWLKTAWNNAVKICGGQASATDPNKYGSVFICSVQDKHNLNTDYAKSVEIGCLETLKYITKFDWQSEPAKIKELIDTLSGVRSINTWGILRNISTNVEADMNKPFNEIYQNVCSMCGGTNFFEYSTTKTLRGVVDFNEADRIPLIEPKIQYRYNKDLTLLVELKQDMVVGQFYGGVLYTPEHARLVGSQFAVLKENNTYKKLQFNGLREIKPLAFSREMFKNMEIKKQFE